MQNKSFLGWFARDKDKVEKKVDRLGLGKAGEDEAVRLLKSMGFKIKERNYRCRGGEIDIVAYDGNTLVFVEVKARTDTSYALPEESVDLNKRARIRTATFDYLSRNSIDEDTSIRFDVVSVDMGKERLSASLIKDAFEADE